MKYFLTYLFLLLSFLGFKASLCAELKKRIHPDGTIEYYSRSKNQEQSETRYPRSRNFTIHYESLINEAAAREGVDPYLVACIIKVESDFDTTAESYAGAMGLMQLMPTTADIYYVADPYDPEENIRAGVKHLKMLLKRFKGDTVLALAAYHAGASRVAQSNGVPSIKATVDYVNKVIFFYTGKKGAARKVKRLKMYVDSEGDIVISDR